MLDINLTKSRKRAACCQTEFDEGTRHFKLPGILLGYAR